MSWESQNRQEFGIKIIKVCVWQTKEEVKNKIIVNFRGYMKLCRVEHRSAVNSIYILMITVNKIHIVLTKLINFKRMG